jgi:hypothetical protein
MVFDGSARRWAAATVLAATLIARPALAKWPAAEAAQPLVQAPRVCAAGIVLIDRRCHVVDFAALGESKRRPWYYAFYATHWADRHGKHDRGFPIIFYLERPATLRLSLWIDDEPGLTGALAKSPPPRPVLTERPDGVFLGFTFKVEGGSDDQRLFRLADLHWKEIDVLHRSAADQALIDQAMPRGCVAAGDGLYDWISFRLRLPLRELAGGAPCGALLVDFAVQDKDKGRKKDKNGEKRLAVIGVSRLPQSLAAPDHAPVPLTLQPSPPTSAPR